MNNEQLFQDQFDSPDSLPETGFLPETCFLQDAQLEECLSQQGAEERDPAVAVAQDVFGVPSLYPWQRLVIANIMECEERYLANQVISQPILDVPKDNQATVPPDCLPKTQHFANS